MPKHAEDAELEPGADPIELEAATDESALEEGPAELLHAEKLTEWDQPPGSSGGPAPTVQPDDEAGLDEELVNEGVEEADRDQRIAAADPDFEP